MRLASICSYTAVFAVLCGVASSPITAGGNKGVPFKGTGTAIPTPVPGDPTKVTNQLAGTMTHLGRWAGISVAQVGVTEEGVLFAEGFQEITAADGSTLKLFIYGEFPNGFRGAVANGTYEIVEGTKRFNGATGSGVFLGGPVDPQTGVRNIGYDGVIVK